MTADPTVYPEKIGNAIYSDRLQGEHEKRRVVPDAALFDPFCIIIQNVLAGQGFPQLHLAARRLFHLAGGEAGGADGYPFHRSVHVRADVLQVRLEGAAGLAGNFRAGAALRLRRAATGVFDAERGFLAAHSAFVGHCTLPANQIVVNAPTAPFENRPKTILPRDRYRRPGRIHHFLIFSAPGNTVKEKCARRLRKEKFPNRIERRL